MIIVNPVEAANILNQGCVVDYQPGDGTRYECQIVKSFGHNHIERWLILRNFEGVSISLNTQWDAIGFAISKTIPAGTWYALRPLLKALGVAKGEDTLNPYDRTREADLRAHGYDGQPLHHGDAALGRQVRRLIESESQNEVF